MNLFPDSQPWTQVIDGNAVARALFDRHYSRGRHRDIHKPKLFVGPGEKLVLLSVCGRALFVWRKFISDDGQVGVNCAVFRNESPGLSSDLIRAAEEIAWRRWPGQRLYTYVDSTRIRSTNPGACFLHAGWSRCGVTKKARLIILEKIPVEHQVS